MNLDLPQTMQKSIQYYANKQGISVNDYIVSAIQTKIDDNQDDDNALFDIDQMKKAIAGCETEELALKNGLHIPQFETREELRAWLKINIPKHLARANQ